MKVVSLKYALGVVCVCAMAACLLSCSQQAYPPVLNNNNYQAVLSNPGTEPLTASTWTLTATAEQSFTVAKDSLINQSCFNCIGVQQAPSCTLVAGDTPMNFSADPSAPFFQLSPQAGIIPPNGSLPISVSYIDSTNLPQLGTTKGTFMISAPNYKSNTQVSFTISCGLADSSGNNACHFALVCPPCSTNAAGNNFLTVASAVRTGVATPASLATYTLAADAALSPGTKVTISGMLDNSFNGTFTIASIPATNQFSVLQPNLPDASTVSGMAYVPEVVTCPWQ